MITLQLVDLDSSTARFVGPAWPQHMTLTMSKQAWVTSGRPTELDVTVEGFIAPKPDPR